MKKISLLLMLIIAGWSLTSCDESHNDYPMPPVYPQEPVITVEGFEATTTAAATQPINLGTMTEDSIQMFTLKLGTLPEGMILKNIRLEAKANDKPKEQPHNVQASNDGYVKKEEFSKLVYAFYGKKATERTFTAQLFADAVKGTEAQLIYLTAPFTLRITPEKLEDPYYYLFGLATGNVSAANAYKYVMTPMEGNDMGFTFTTKYTAKKAGDLLVWNISYWKKDFPKKDFSKVYGTETKYDKSEKGVVIQGEKDNYFIAPTAQYYTFVVDLEALTFEWKLLDDQNPASYTKISMIGAFNSWNETDNSEIDLTAVDPSKHNWYVRHTFASDTELKFRANHDYSVMNWGYGNNDKEWDAGEDWAKICEKDKKNIAVPAGTYDIYFCDITGAAHFVPVEE